MGIFDIFGDVVKLTKSDNVIKLNDVDMSKVTKEELDEAMDFLDRLKDNDFVTLLIGDEYIDNFKAELQSKWDMSHESPEPEPKKVPTIPRTGNITVFSDPSDCLIFSVSIILHFNHFNHYNYNIEQSLIISKNRT